MSWEQSQQELEKAFTTEGILGKKMSSIIKQEVEHRELIRSSFGGHQVISLSFQEFMAETLKIASEVRKVENRKAMPPAYSEVFRWHLANFRSVRATELLFSYGYPFDGLARLRLLKESALFLGAMLSGITTYPRINGDDLEVIKKGGPFTKDYLGKMRTRRMDEERRVLGLMIRKDSKLSITQIAELQKWENFFHLEVHGSRLTRFVDIRSGKPNYLGPKFNEQSCAMFINRYSEICWMLLRTLPILQLSHSKFGDSWVRKWKLLDSIFYEVETGLIASEKPFFRAFVDFMASKFNFNPDYCFDTHVKYP